MLSIRLYSYKTHDVVWMAGDARELLALATRIGKVTGTVELAAAMPCDNPDGVELWLAPPEAKDTVKFVWPCLGVAAVVASIEALAEGKCVEATFELLPGQATLLVERVAEREGFEPSIRV
jgi:hypothetical protein